MTPLVRLIRALLPAAIAVPRGPNPLGERSDYGPGLAQALTMAGRLGVTRLLSDLLCSSGWSHKEKEIRTAVVAGMMAEESTRLHLELLRDLLASAEIGNSSPIILKGAAFYLQGLYSGERDLSDTDVLVALDSLPLWKSRAREIGAEWEPAGGGHEIGYFTRGRARLELHSSLPGSAGRDTGPDYQEVLPETAPLAGSSGPRCLQPGAARDLSIHHFAIHHDCDPLHAIRTLQDLSRLGPVGGDGSIRWKSVDLDKPGARLQKVIDETVASGGAIGPVGSEFAARLEASLSVAFEPEIQFFRDVNRWLGHVRQSGGSATDLAVTRALDSAPAENEQASGRSPFSAAKRIGRLGGRYLRGFAQTLRPGAGGVRTWRRFILTQR